MLTLQELIARLDGVKQRHDGQYTAHCPCKQNHSHNDKTRSFEFSQDTKTGRLLVFCQKGCTLDEICASLGCTTADLMPEPTEQEKQRNFLEWYAGQNGLTLEAVYSYCYGDFADGLAKVRFRQSDGEKTFRWIKNDPQNPGKYKLNRQGCPNRLYVRGSLDRKRLFLAEGEKDADTLHKWTKETAVSTENGATATGRGKKWQDEYTAQITGKDVYILWDNDEAGRNFASIEAAAMKGHAANVYMLNILDMWPDCPEKGDISDMVEALGTDETFSRLAKLIKETQPEPADEAEVYDFDGTIGDPGDKDPAADPSLSMENQTGEAQQTTTEPAAERSAANSILSIEKFMDKVQSTAFMPIPTGIEEFDALINGGFIRQTLVTLGASPGAGKTVIAQQIMEAAAENGNADILYFNLEMSEEQLLARSLSRRSGVSQTEVMRGYAWTDDQRRKITTAAQYYTAKIAPHIAYNPVDKEGNPGSAIYQAMLATMEQEAPLHNPEKPLIVCVDYLQLLQDEKGAEDAETIKAALKAFKDFAIKHDAVVFMIMAHNRMTNLTGTISQGAGRDTSAIEYSGDLQLSLNYGAIADGTFDSLPKMEKAIANPERTDATEDLYNYRCLTVTKNRFGQDRLKCYMTFDGEQSRFDFTTKCRKYTNQKQQQKKPTRSHNPYQ